MRIKEKETSLTLQEHDDNDDEREKDNIDFVFQLLNYYAYQ